MPKGIYQRTEYHNAISRKNGFKKGCIPWDKGKTFSESHKNKLKQKRKGKTPTLGKHWKVKDTSNISKSKMGKKRLPMTNEQKEKISKSRKGKYTGIKNHSWQGGKSFEPYGMEFSEELRERIRGRNNYRCQECFRHQDELFTKSGRRYKLIVHHIDYDKKNNHPNNLISLCRNCHCQTNFSRENWQDYFQSKINQSDAFSNI